MAKKIILISGGSDGLGKSIAMKLAPNHQVIILSHNEEKLKAVSAEINCDYVLADVTDYSSLEKAVQQIITQHGRLDVLVNNAGIWLQGSLEENTPEQISEVFKVNTLGSIFLTKAVIPQMKSQSGGRIINIVSQDGLRAKQNRSIYSASKWAMTGFTKCLLEDLSQFKIGVTAINPGLLKTSLFEKQGANRDLSHALELIEVSNLVEFVINLPPETILPDVGIKNINNSTIMDDKSAPPIGLDINPDLITPQSSVPQASSSTTVTNTVQTEPLNPVTSTTTNSGVIDITPGSSSAPVTVTTPATVSTPGITLPVDQGVIDITPNEAPPTSSPAAGDMSSGHLADIVPQDPSAPPAPTTTITESATMTVPTPGPVESPLTPATETTVTTVTETTPIAEPIAPATPLDKPVPENPTPASPYSENPDLVTLGK